MRSPFQTHVATVPDRASPCRTAFGVEGGASSTRISSMPTIPTRPVFRMWPHDTHRQCLLSRCVSRHNTSPDTRGYPFPGSVGESPYTSHAVLHSVHRGQQHGPHLPRSSDVSGIPRPVTTQGVVPWRYSPNQSHPHARSPPLQHTSAVKALTDTHGVAMLHGCRSCIHVGGRAQAGMTAGELEEATALQQAHDDAAPPLGDPSPPSGAGGPSYATLFRLGLAAPTGPVVGSADSGGQAAPPLASSPASRAWGPRPGGPAVAAPAPVLKGAWGAGRPASAPPPPAEDSEQAAPAGGPQRNKKGQQVRHLLQRRVSVHASRHR